MAITLNQYQKTANRTLATIEYKIDLFHMVTGLHSEYNEYTSAIKNQDHVNICEEIGDMFWYLSNYCYIRRIRLDSLDQTLTNKDLFRLDILPVLTSKLQDLIKKHCIYGKDIDTQEELILLASIFNRLKSVCYPSELLLILETNLLKLMIRYPDKYTDEKAVERDLVKERELLINMLRR